MNNLPARIPQGQQPQNIIVPYDGLGMMEVRNPQAPKQESGLFSWGKKPDAPAPGQRPTPRPGQRPRLIQPIEGIVYADPQGVYEFLINKGYPVKNTASSTLRWARTHVTKNGESGVKDLLRLHPDKDLIMDACRDMVKESSFSGDEEIDGTKLKDVATMTVKELESKVTYWGNQVSMGLVNKDLGNEFINKAKESIKERSNPDLLSLKLDKKNALLYGIIGLLVVLVVISLLKKRVA
jgi:hypothetical protein